MIAHFILAGQSNVDQWFHSDGGAPLEAFKQTFLALNPQYTDVQFFDAARGGSAILGGSALQYADARASEDADLHERISQNYWYDESTGTAGPNLTLFAERLEAEVASGTEFLGIIWAQGEADTTYVDGTTAEEYTEGLAYVLDQLMEASGAEHTYIQALGDRSFYSEDLHGGTDEIRAAQQELADGSDRISIATTIFDLALRDSVHLTDADYVIAAQRMAVAISTGETSAAVGETVLLDENTILVQFTLATSQSFTSTFGLGGFTLSENGAEIEIVSAHMTSTGLLRIETEQAVVAPTVSYGSALDSLTMQQEDYIYISGANGSAPILPFELVLSAPRLDTQDILGGLQIEGSHLSETLTGLSGDDILIGNAGHDTLNGGWGSDQLYGGEGSDVFVLGGDGALDTVHDFDLGADAIGLLGMSQAGVSFQAWGDGDLEVAMPDGSRVLLKNVGLEDAGSIRFYTLGTDASNKILGHEGDDRVFAGGGDDIIDTGAGYDRITTGEGADIVAFGTGYGTNIVYDFDIALDSIELTNLQAASLTYKQYNGTDLELRTESGDRLILRDVAASDIGLLNIADAPPTTGIITGTEGNDVLRGTALDELFTASGGTDRLYGGGGRDVFEFREGSGLNIVYDFEDGRDVILIDAPDFETLAILAYKGSDAEIRLDSGDRLVLRDIDPSLINADDFVFSVPEDFV
jgi:Ca2+-binding RTX toxin-like protein